MLGACILLLVVGFCMYCVCFKKVMLTHKLVWLQFAFVTIKLFASHLA